MHGRSRGPHPVPLRRDGLPREGRLEMRRSSALVAALLAASVVAPTLFAQDSGSLTGSVRTDSGLPVPQIPLSLQGPVARSVVSGPAGRYRVTGLPSGAYTI